MSIARTLLAAAIALAAAPALAQISDRELAEKVRSASNERGKIDFENAEPRPLPIYREYTAQSFRKDIIASLSKEGVAIKNLRVSRSGRGDGKLLPDKVPAAKKKGKPVAQAHGTANVPFSTARADLEPAATNSQWPYRAAGKIFYNDAKKSYTCSGALIRRGLVVTAAHCIVKYGTDRPFNSWVFVPGLRDEEAPYGRWDVAKFYVLDQYAKGKADCKSNDAVCLNDVGVLALVPKEDGKTIYFPGDRTGWFSVAYGDAPFTSAGLVHITQLGYPACLDDAALMQRNDAQAAISQPSQNNTVYGSLMCEGSSGGPIVVNFGIAPQLTQTVAGGYPQPNVIIGVTSWGTDDKDWKQQGASPLVAGNIDYLIRAACKDFPDACK